MQIKIKYIEPNMQKIEYKNNSDWVDLRCSETLEIKAGEFKLIPLGIAMELPPNFEANFVPRSSTFKNFGLLQTNHFSVIDESYKGDNDQWYFPAYATRDVTVNKNDRICQFRINKKQPPLEFEEVEFLGNDDRQGFGSTGIQ